MCVRYWFAVSGAYGCTLILLYYLSWPQILNLWVTCGVEMMPLSDGWGWYPPQTASQIWARYIQSVWAIDILTQGHIGAPLYQYTGQVGPNVWNLGHFLGGNDVITSWLRLISTSDCFPHPYKTYKMCLSYWYSVSRAYGCTLVSLYQQSWLQILEFGSMVEWIWCHYIMVEADIHLRLVLTYIRHI